MRGDNRYQASLTHVGKDAPEHIARHYGQERLKSRIKVLATGCWEWQGWKQAKGYGLVSYRNQNWSTHRLAYFLWKGPIPEGMCVCHTCDHRPCINPEHLFLGTTDQNNKDMAAKGRCKYSAQSWTHCKKGHEFTPENTARDNRGFRHCKTCSRERQRKRNK